MKKSKESKLPDITNRMVDRFGEKVDTETVDDNHFRLTAAVAESHVFYAWIFGFCGKVKIEAPEDMRKAYQKMVKAAAK